MQRIEVKSSLLSAIGYDKESRTLIVEFKPKNPGEAGKSYKYDNVTPETFERFKAAPSLGSHFLKEIKPAHACTRLGEEKKDAKDEKKNSKGRKAFRTSEPPEETPF